MTYDKATVGKSELANDSARDIVIRSACVVLAIKSGCGQYFNDEGKMLNCDAQIVEAARKFESFIKGTKE